MCDLNIGVMCHMFHADLFKSFRPIFSHLPEDSSLHLTTCSSDNADNLKGLFKDWSGLVNVIEIPNRGRDIAPKLVSLAQAHHNYDLVLHLHTKASHPQWREHCMRCLINSRERVNEILSRFDADPGLGMIGPEYWPPIKSWIEWGSNRPAAEKLMVKANIDPLDVLRLEFPAGSMFWARPAALRPLFDLQLRAEDFEEEPLGDDGSLAHALERLFYIAAEAAGFRWQTVDERGVFANGQLVYHRSPEDYRLHRMGRILVA